MTFSAVTTSRANSRFDLRAGHTSRLQTFTTRTVNARGLVSSDGIFPTTEKPILRANDTIKSLPMKDMANMRESIMDSSMNLDPKNVLDSRTSFQRSTKKDWDLEACAPITILVDDDDEPDIAEIGYIDLESDDRASAKGRRIVQSQQSGAPVQPSGFQPVPKRQSTDESTQQRTRDLDPATHTKNVAQPLFRTLTKDDLSALHVRPVPETSHMGFKAWCQPHDSLGTGNAPPTVQRKRAYQSPSIIMFNDENPKNKARSDPTAPQFAMNILKPNRKRTIGELGYNELISPAQVESPSEKLARIAKRRRQNQGMRDPWSQNTSHKNAESAIDLDLADEHEHRNEQTTEKQTELTVSPILHDRLERQGTVARQGEERDGPLVREPPPVSTGPSTEGQSDYPTKSRREDDNGDPMDAHEIGSHQTTAHEYDTQDHDNSINAASLTGSRSSKPRDRKRRMRGPTKVCGVYSPEIKPPVKNHRSGPFSCPRCDSKFTRPDSAKYHFEGCIAKYGNPRSLRWDDHPSLIGERMRVTPKDKNEQRLTVSARIQTVQDDTRNNTQEIGSINKPAPITHWGSPSPASNSRVPDRLIPQEKPSMTEKQQSYLDSEPMLNDRTPTVEHRATGGKGISAETLKIYQETGNWNLGRELSKEIDAKDEGGEVPDIAYHYSVQRREWLDTEEDAIEASLGPYYTMNEANAVAMTEVQYPQTDGLEGIQPKGWSYHFEQDEHGMQTHRATILEVNIEAVVHRELAPPSERVPIPESAFVVTERVYIVQELQWLPTPDIQTGTGLTHCQSLTHGVYTQLKLANERAAAEYVESSTGHLGDSECDIQKKTDAKTDLDKKVQVLTQKAECFCEEIKSEDGGFARVWVEMVVVEGPRN